MPLSGSCGCGAVQFEVSQTPETLSSCYCRTCQKLHSAAYATFARVSTVKWIKRDTLESKRFSTFASRTRCGSCGSQIYMEYFYRPHIVNICAALFDSPTDLPKVGKLIYLKDKFTWDTGVAYKDVDCYDALPEAMQQQVDAWEALGTKGAEIRWSQ
jgi:hypothetical protein